MSNFKLIVTLPKAIPQQHEAYLATMSPRANAREGHHILQVAKSIENATFPHKPLGLWARHVPHHQISY